MTLPSSPPILLSQLKTEFGGDTIPNLTDYYAGGSFVGSGAANGTGHAIPSSGRLHLSDFYGAHAFVAQTVSHTTAGAGTETIPGGARFVVIECVGASGGGGGGSRGIAKAAANSGGGGGGSGGISRTAAIAITGGDTILFHVGALGAAGACATAAGNTATPGSPGGASNVASGYTDYYITICWWWCRWWRCPRYGERYWWCCRYLIWWCCFGTTNSTGNPGATGSNTSGGLGGTGLVPVYSTAPTGGKGGVSLVTVGTEPIAGGVGRVNFHYT